MAVESTVDADSSETVVPSMNEEVSEGTSNSEQASPDSSCVLDEQTNVNDSQQQETGEMETPPPRRQSSVIRLIRPELLMKEERIADMTPPRIDVIVNPHQFQPEFRPVMRRLNNIKRPSSNGGGTNASAVVSSSTSPGPSSRTPPPTSVVLMGPPPPPAAVAAPTAAKNGAAKSPPGQRIRKSTAGAQRRHPASPPDHEEPSSSIPEIGKSFITTLFSSFVRV